MIAFKHKQCFVYKTVNAQSSHHTHVMQFNVYWFFHIGRFHAVKMPPRESSNAIHTYYVDCRLLKTLYIVRNVTLAWYNLKHEDKERSTGHIILLEHNVLTTVIFFCDSWHWSTTFGANFPRIQIHILFERQLAI